MWIRFNETRRLAEDGFVVKQFEAGQRYYVADRVARVAIRNGWAKEAV